MKKLAALLLTLALAASLTVPALAAEFSDVPAGHNFHDAIAACSEAGIAGGYGDGSFRPGNTVTRSNFCVMLSRAFYPEDVAKHSGESAEGSFTPNYAALRDHGILTGASFGGAALSPEAMNQGISRYDMALLMTNIMNNKGQSASAAEKTAAAGQISDYSQIPSQYRDAVANVFALGLIGGYADGSFRGTVTMNRGQAAVVIHRMSQRLPLSGPVEAPGETPQEPAEPAGATLTNGKEVNAKNVILLMNQLRVKYPQGYDFSKGYPAGNSSPVRQATNKYTRAKGGITSNTIDCGGWATMISDAIFGTTAPCRKIDVNKAQAGDIVICLNKDGKLTHVMLISHLAIKGTDETEGMKMPVYTTESGGSNFGQWNDVSPIDIGADYRNQGLGYYEVWTRYPD